MMEILIVLALAFGVVQTARLWMVRGVDKEMVKRNLAKGYIMALKEEGYDKGEALSRAQQFYKEL